MYGRHLQDLNIGLFRYISSEYIATNDAVYWQWMDWLVSVWCSNLQPIISQIYILSENLSMKTLSFYLFDVMMCIGSGWISR
jgi:hypothetical protein